LRAFSAGSSYLKYPGLASAGAPGFPTLPATALRKPNVSIPIVSTDLQPDLFNREFALPYSSAPMVPVPSFATEGLILKPLSLADIPSYETHFIDYEVIRHQIVRRQSELSVHPRDYHATNMRHKSAGHWKLGFGDFVICWWSFCFT